MARRQAHELGLGDRRPGAHVLHHLPQRHRPVVVHVGRHLRPVAILEIEADRTHPGETAARLAQSGGDLPREPEVIGLEVDVEGHERRAGRGKHRAGGGVQPGGP